MNIPSNSERSFIEGSEWSFAASQERTKDLKQRVGKWQELSVKDAKRGDIQKVEGSLFTRIVNTFANFLYRHIHKEAIEMKFQTEHLIKFLTEMDSSHLLERLETLDKVMSEKNLFTGVESSQINKEWQQLKLEYNILSQASQLKILTADNFDKITSVYRGLENGMGIHNRIAEIRENLNNLKNIAELGANLTGTDLKKFENDLQRAKKNYTDLHLPEVSIYDLSEVRSNFKIVEEYLTKQKK